MAVLAALFLFRRSAVIVHPFKGLIASFVIAFVVALLFLLIIPAGRRVLRDFREVAAIVLRRGSLE
jgi:hypothetical protein